MLLTVPPLYCPIPPAIHPDADAIGARTIEWMASFGTYRADETLRHRSIGNRAGEWVGRLAPDGAGERLQIFSDWVCFGFDFDDLYCDLGRTSKRPHEFIGVALRMLHRLDNPECPALDDNPCAEALRDLSRRVRACASPHLVRRWADGHRSWLLGAAAGIAGRSADGSGYGVPVNLILRNWDAALRVCHSLIEIAEDTDLPDRQREDPAIRAVTEAAYTLVVLVNDLFSYRNDVSGEVTNTNTVALQGLEETVRLHDRVMCLFLILGERIHARAGSQVRQYLGQLRHYVRGNLDWSRTVPRYNQGGWAQAEEADAPADGALSPPPIPSIAWWWEQLR